MKKPQGKNRETKPYMRKGVKGTQYQYRRIENKINMVGEKMKCPICKDEMVWQSCFDVEESETVFYSCFTCYECHFEGFHYYGEGVENFFN